MIELLAVIAGAVLGYFLGQFVLLSRLAKVLAESDRDQPDRSHAVIPARLDEHNGIFLLHRIDNNEFLAQGTSAAELERRTLERIGSDGMIVVTDSDAGVLSRYRISKNGKMT